MRTDFKDDIFDGKRKYNMINNPDGTVSFTDVTVYTQTGDSFGAKEINEMGNELAGKQDKLISGTNIKTLNGESLLGTGNIFIKGGTSSDEVTAKRADVLKGKTTIMNDSADEIVEGTLEVQSIVNFNLSLYASETVMGAWRNPAKGPYSGVKIIYRTDRYPNGPDDGTVAYEGSGISFTKTLPAGTKHYFSAFSYMTTNFGRIYSSIFRQSEFTTTTVQGRQVFKSNGTFTVPTGVRSVQVFLVGGGGGGSRGYDGGQAGHGGGGGYTKTQNVSVTPGQNIVIVVGGGGGEATNGGTSKFGSVSVSGGEGGKIPYNNLEGNGKAGNGGSGGGRGGRNYGVDRLGGNGGSDGSDGTVGKEGEVKAIGQHSTTREFAQSGATLYSGGGAGGGSDVWAGRPGNPGAGGGGAVDTTGSANSGGGGGAGKYFGSKPGQPGGSGIVIVRWGY